MKPHATQDQQIHHFLWIVSTFSEYTVVPDSALARIVVAAPRDKVCLSVDFPLVMGLPLILPKLNLVQLVPSSVWEELASPLLLAVRQLVLPGSLGSTSTKIHLPRLELGATECINPQDFKKPIQEVLVEMTGHGVDDSFEVTGCVATMSGKTKDSMAKLVSSYMKKKFNQDVLITHTLPLDKINEGFELLHSAKR
ncbi:unnamed protein product [Eretmochelys imbricata]